jgi:hypothetical protein
MTTDGTPVGHALYYWLRLVEGAFKPKLFSDMLDRPGALPLWPSRRESAGFCTNRRGVGGGATVYCGRAEDRLEILGMEFPRQQE